MKLPIVLWKKGKIYSAAYMLSEELEMMRQIYKRIEVTLQISTNKDVDNIIACIGTDSNEKMARFENKNKVKFFNIPSNDKTQKRDRPIRKYWIDDRPEWCIKTRRCKFYSIEKTENCDKCFCNKIRMEEQNARIKHAK